ncbi:MAG TPA: glycoside hydrolase family 13 protein [Gaiellaceae bacterium]|nr:glycoside hydrolase family 13 protein [Gaiellaceae bacterium]
MTASLADPAAPARTALAEPHHDGSEAYVLDAPDELGGEASVRLRVPRGTAVDQVALRYVHDGEARVVSAQLDEEDEHDEWWLARLPVRNPVTPYRWLLAGGEVGYGWVNGNGLVLHDVPDADDFVFSVRAGGPDWHLGSVVYEIFPDRFARGGVHASAPAWAVPRAWDEPVTGRGPEASTQWYGGDLRGIAERLGHVEALGANVIYLTPLFPARSTHRYDATSFDRIDPLLGGDEALDALVRAARARGIRVVADLTTNHVGAGHEWFRAARETPGALEREFFLFDEALPHGYESWLGVEALPKLDWRSGELRERMLGVVRRWLDAGLDGWRIDVANMTARHGSIDLNVEVARAVRAAAGDALVVAEHAHDFRADLAAGGWQGVMNYAGFMRPTWAWLRGETLPDGLRRGFWAMPVGLPELPAGAAVAAMRGFRAGVPWPSVLHSWTLLDSHDTARFRSVAGSRERQLVGVGLQLTTPGVPMLFAGDELGLEGEWAEDARRTMPWDRPDAWDRVLHGHYRRLIALRRSSEALARGGIRYAHVGDDAIAYLRETPRERLLCLASRGAAPAVRLPLAALGATALETVEGADATVDDGVAVLPAEGPAFHVWRLV